MESLPLHSPNFPPPAIDFTESKLQMRLYFNGEDYFASVLESLAAARFEILIESYIFAYDQIGQKILLQLQQAVRRGVKVRVLVDGVGSFESLPDLSNFCKLTGINFEIYHPLPFQIHLSHSLALLGFERLRRRFALMARVNKRNHRKLILIDGETCYLGSLNISDIHLTTSSRKGWRDTGLMIKGPEVALIKREMEATWKKSENFISKVKRTNRLPAWLRFNSRRRWRRRVTRDLLAYIANAQERVLITTPYFVPSPKLLRYLRRASKRGVAVSILLPFLTDVPLIRHVSRAFYRDLMDWGIKIWEYQPTVLHAKTMIIDHYAFVGSQNVNHRSLLHDLEVEIVTTKKDLVDELSVQWEKDLSQALCATGTLHRLKWVDKLLSWFFVHFKYWL